jgi:catechol-2,3-dioxygenase
MFTNIRALAIYVTDMQRAKKFYMDVLGFELSADLGPNLCFLKSQVGEYLHLYGRWQETLRC